MVERPPELTGGVKVMPTSWKATLVLLLLNMLASVVVSMSTGSSKY